MIHGPLVFLFMNGRSVEQWMNHEPLNEWEEMMKKVAAFHAKHDFAVKTGHDMGYRLALTIEELGELAAAIKRQTPRGMRRGNGGCADSADGAQPGHGN